MFSLTSLRTALPRATSLRMSSTITAPSIASTITPVAPPVESPLIAAFVNNIMKSGKKTTARRIVSDALKHIQLETSKDAHAVLATAVEKIEPLFKVVGVKQGAKSVQTPKALNEKQRRRTAIIWLVEAANSRNQKDPAGIRLGKEIIAVMNDESSAIQKRNLVHKNALANRSNVVLVDRRIRKSF